MPRRVRRAFSALWNLDLALADVVSTSTDARLGAIRLAWWRERLDELDTEGPIAGEPRLSAINRHLMPVTNGAMLSMIAAAWMPALDPFPWGREVAEGFRARGERLFEVGAQILRSDAPSVGRAGALWSLADAAFHCSDAESREFLLGEARAAIEEVPRRMPRELRALTVLAALAAHDVLRSGRLSRVAAAMNHRLFGTIPRS
jgi:phytoene synthase